MRFNIYYLKEITYPVSDSIKTKRVTNSHLMIRVGNDFWKLTINRIQSEGRFHHPACFYLIERIVNRYDAETF